MSETDWAHEWAYAATAFLVQAPGLGTRVGQISSQGALAQLHERAKDVWGPEMLSFLLRLVGCQDLSVQTPGIRAFRFVGRSGFRNPVQTPGVLARLFLSEAFAEM